MQACRDVGIRASLGRVFCGSATASFGMPSRVASARHPVLLCLLTLVLFSAMPMSHGQVSTDVGLTNPFSGDSSEIEVHSFVVSDGTVRASLTVTGSAGSGGFQLSERFDVEIEAEESEGRIGLTVAVAEAVAQQIRSSASGVKDRLELLYLWSGEDAQRFNTLEEFLAEALGSFEQDRISDGACMMREALRLLFVLRGRLSSGTEVDYVQGLATLFLLVLFSLFTARLLFTRASANLVVVLFAVTLSAFGLSHPYVRVLLYQAYSAVADYPKLLERPDYLLLLGMVLASPLFILFVVMRGWKASGYSVLEQTVRSMKARRMRSVLAMTTIIIVGVASMVHSSASVSLKTAPVTLPFTSGVAYGLVVLKYRVDFPTTREPGGEVVLIEPAEARWISELFGGASSACGMREVPAATQSSASMQLVLAGLNLTYAQDYLGLNISFAGSGTGKDSSDWVVASWETLEKYGVAVDGVLFVKDRAFRVVGTFSREETGKLVDLDGYPLFPKVIDGRLQPGSGEMVDLITDEASFASLGSAFMKVSCALTEEGQVVLREGADRLLVVGTDIRQEFVRRMSYGPTIYRVRGSTYLLHIVEKAAVSEVFPATRVLQITGFWPAQAVVTAIGAGIIYVTALAVVYEKRKDFRVMSIVGARPSFITFSLMVEGLFMGVVGGVLSYGAGYLGIWTANALFPGNIVAVPAGIFYMLLVTAVSILTTTAGYLVPARDAIRLVIPSGLLKRDVGEVASRERGQIALDVPLRVHLREQRLLELFLLRDFPSMFAGSPGDYHGLTVKNAAEKEDEHGIAFVFEACYTPVSISKQPIPLLLCVRADRQVDHLVLKATVQSDSLHRFSRLDLREVLMEIRANLLHYVDWKHSAHVDAETNRPERGHLKTIEEGSGGADGFGNSIREARENLARILTSEELPLGAATANRTPGVYLLFIGGKIQCVGSSDDLSRTLSRLLSGNRASHPLVDRLCQLYECDGPDVSEWLRQNARVRLLEMASGVEAERFERLLAALCTPAIDLACPG